MVKLANESYSKLAQLDFSQRISVYDKFIDQIIEQKRIELSFLVDFEAKTQDLWEKFDDDFVKFVEDPLIRIGDKLEFFQRCSDANVLTQTLYSIMYRHLL